MKKYVLGILFVLVFVIGYADPPAMSNEIYGSILIDRNSAPAGTTIEAKIQNGANFIISDSITLPLANCPLHDYCLSIKADDTSTQEKDGGTINDEIKIYINGNLATTSVTPLLFINSMDNPEGREVNLVLNNPTCTESWTCTEWSALSTCTSNTQTRTRTCTDSNSCGTTTTKPAEFESQSCTTTTPTSGPPGPTTRGRTLPDDSLSNLPANTAPPAPPSTPPPSTPPVTATPSTTSKVTGRAITDIKVGGVPVIYPVIAIIGLLVVFSVFKVRKIGRFEHATHRLTKAHEAKLGKLTAVRERIKQKQMEALERKKRELEKD